MKKIIVLRRDGEDPKKDRVYCSKHLEDVTIIPCQFCGADISELIKTMNPKHRV